MKRLRFNGVGNLGVETAEDPLLGPKDALVQVHRCGVCGTDLSMWKGTFHVPNLPLTPGHELSGEIVALGRDVTGGSVGTRVAVDINMTCNQCFWCRKGEHLLCPHLSQIGIHQDGGMAEYVAVPAHQLIPLPDSVSYDAAAAIEPIACVLHAQDRAAIGMGESVVVIGSGTMGALHARLAQLRGADPVILVGKYEERQEVARRMGIGNLMLAQDPRTPKEIKEMTSGRGADVVVEAAGSPSAYELAFKVVRRGGRLLAYGVPPAGQLIQVEPFRLFNDQLSILGAFVTNPGAWLSAVQLLATGRLDVSPMQKVLVSLDRAPDTERYLSQDRSLFKILIDPTAPEGTVVAIR